MNKYIYSILIGFVFSWIVSSDSERSLSVAVGKCYDDPQNSRCFVETIPKHVKKYGVSQTIELITKESESRSLSCHSEAHLVGESALSKVDRLPVAIAECSDSCDYGCVHGVMAKTFRVAGIDNLEEISQKCLETEFEIKTQDVTACFHGIGHGIAEYAGYDLANALVMCDQLSDAARKKECASGVIMEIMDMNIGGERTLPEIDSGLCLGSPPDLLTYCTITMNNKYLIRHKDYKLPIKHCLEFDNNETKNECFSALGGEVVFVYPNDLSMIWTVCTSQQRELMTESCLKGAMYSTLVTDTDGEMAMNLCKHTDRSISKTQCFGLVETLLRDTGNPNRVAICDKLKAEESYDCQI